MEKSKDNSIVETGVSPAAGKVQKKELTSIKQLWGTQIGKTVIISTGVVAAIFATGALFRAFAWVTRGFNEFKDAVKNKKKE